MVALSNSASFAALASIAPAMKRYISLVRGAGIAWTTTSRSIVLVA